MSPGRPPWMSRAFCLGVPLVLSALGMVAGCTGTPSDDDDSTTTAPTDEPTTSTPPDNSSPTPCQVDVDSDGFCPPDDCNDGDASISPNASDVCDPGGVDTNCDGINECAVDNDGDGYSEDGSLGGQPDCNDESTAIYPGASEGSACDDIDQDCDGTADDGAPCKDDDGDGFSEQQGDCDDSLAISYPGAPEWFDAYDNDCDGQNEAVYMISRASAHNVFGEQKEDRVGFSVGGGADVNLDGYSDFIIGATGFGGSFRGAALLYFGHGGPWNLSSASTASPIIFKEPQIAAKAGWSVGMVGDANLDGAPELVIGAPYVDDATSLVDCIDCGRAYVILGRTTEWASGDLDKVSETIMPGYFDGVYLGFSVAGGSIGTDEFADTLVGAPQSSQLGNYGWSFTMPGRSDLPNTAQALSITQLQGSGDMQLGQTTAYLGDVTGDGVGDYATGGQYTNNKEGFVVFIPGSADYNSPKTFDDFNDTHAIQFIGATEGEAAGGSKDLLSPSGSLAGNGDVDGDGTDDFIVADGGSIKDREDPIAFLFLGGSKFLGGSIPSSDGVFKLPDVANIAFLASAADDCPCSVSVSGDLNGDYINDILLGVSEANNGAGASGRVYVFLGRADLPTTLIPENDADYILESESLGEHFGSTVSWIGDVNGDGYGDFLVGAPGTDTEATIDTGTAYLFFGFAPVF